MKNPNMRGAIALVAVIALIVVHADVSRFCNDNDNKVD